MQTLLAQHGSDSQIMPIRTSGDDPHTREPTGVAIKGLFTKEIEQALLDGSVDLAVHSLKDLTLEMPDGLVLAAFPERDDVRDSVVSTVGGGLESLPRGARVGTSSLRRRAAVLSMRPDVIVAALHGNVPTRLRKVDDREVDAAILALAGLRRLGLQERAIPLDPTQFVPAPGQGALAIQARGDDARSLWILRQLDRREVRIEVEAERATLRWLGGDCQTPIGAICTRQGRDPILHVRVYAPDGTRVLAARSLVDPSDPGGVGRRVADDLLARGAADLMGLPDVARQRE